MNCPCNPQKKYTNCCKIAHDNIGRIETAEQLMRSRYSAFVLAIGSYLQQSHHSKTRPSKKENKETTLWAKSVDWIKLEVMKTTNGLFLENEGAVLFKAYYLEDGKMGIIEEHSFFKKERGNWMYVDALTR